MKRTAAYRITADLCFFFSILSIFPAFRPWQTPMALFAAACLAVSLVAVHCPYAVLRLLLALLPGLAFWNAKLSFLLVFPALGWLYVILMLTAGRFHLWLDEYRRIYRAMLIVCLCSIAANVAHSTVYSGDVISYPSMIYALLFLCLGVLAMRGMQMNANMGAPWRITNALTVIGVPTLAIGASTLLYLLLRSLRPVVEWIFRPIGLFVLWLFGLLFPGEYVEAVPTPTPDHTPLPTPTIIEEPVPNGASMVAAEDRSGYLINRILVEKAAMIGGYVVLAILLLAAVFFIVRYVRRNRAESEQDEFVYEETEEDVRPRKRRAGKAVSVAGNAQHIRKIYRQYMELMREHGVRIQRDSTSLDILDEAEQVNLSPAAKRLRELYLKARYAQADAVSREDVQEAQRCLQEIRSEFKS